MPPNLAQIPPPSRDIATLPIDLGIAVLKVTHANVALISLIAKSWPMHSRVPCSKGRHPALGGATPL